MPQADSDSASIRLLTLAQLSARGSWQLELAHDRAESLLIWLTRGQGLALMDGVRRGIGAHNALFIPAGTVMSIELGRQGFGQALCIRDTSGLNLPRKPVHLRTREAPAQIELNGLLDAMMREQVAGRAMLDTAMAAHAALISVWLHRQIDRVGPEILPDTPSVRLMRAFMARIVQPDAEMISLEEHAAVIGVTPTHLARVSKAETGRTAAALITERRLHRARSLLAETETPIQDIARQLGFASAAYFTRFIQQHCGIGPSALRRNPARPLPGPPPAISAATTATAAPPAPQLIRARVAFGPGSDESKR